MSVTVALVVFPSTRLSGGRRELLADGKGQRMEVSRAPQQQQQQREQQQQQQSRRFHKMSSEEEENVEEEEEEEEEREEEEDKGGLVRITIPVFALEARALSRAQTASP